MSICIRANMSEGGVYSNGIAIWRDPMVTTHGSMWNISLTNLSLNNVLARSWRARLFKRLKLAPTRKSSRWTNGLNLAMTWTGAFWEILRFLLWTVRIELHHLTRRKDVQTRSSPTPVVERKTVCLSIFDMSPTHMWTLELLYWIVQLPPSPLNPVSPPF